MRNHVDMAAVCAGESLYAGKSIYARESICVTGKVMSLIQGYQVTCYTFQCGPNYKSRGNMSSSRVDKSRIHMYSTKYIDF